MKKSSKTTITGWLTLAIGILGAAVSLISGEGIGDLTPITTALMAIGVTVPGWLQGLFSRDHGVSSQSAGVE